MPSAYGEVLQLGTRAHDTPFGCTRRECMVGMFRMCSCRVCVLRYSFPCDCSPGKMKLSLTGLSVGRARVLVGGSLLAYWSCLHHTLAPLIMLSGVLLQSCHAERRPSCTGLQCKTLISLCDIQAQTYAAQLDFTDKSQLAVHYFVLPNLRQHVALFGNFQAGRAYLGPKEGNDPFGRTHSVMPWDREEQKHLLQDPR